MHQARRCVRGGVQVVMPAYTPEQMSEQYNNGKRVPDFADYLARWRAASRAARARLRHEADIAYGPAPRQRIDLFRPESEAGVPLLVFAHGGYWQMLDKADWSCIAAPYVARGIAVAIVGYTLCPAISVAGIVDELRRACAFLYLNAQQYRIERAGISISGHSAGGHLAAMMLATDWPAFDARLPARMFRAAVAVSGLFDLEPLTVTPLNQALQLTPQQALASSPILMPRLAPETPLLAVVGGAESAEFLRQSKSLALQWAATRYREEPGCNHFSVIDAFHDPAAPLFAACCELILAS